MPITIGCRPVRRCQALSGVTEGHELGCGLVVGAFEGGMYCGALGQQGGGRMGIARGAWGWGSETCDL